MPAKIPWWLPQVGSGAERIFLTQALDNNYINEGPLVTQFETKIAALVNAKYAIATPSCTVGLFLALKALGIGHGDEVLVPDITFIATANAVDLCGATPILVDVDPATFTIDCGQAEKRITAKTKAIMPVHVTGRGADMSAVMALATRHNLFVVEDAAEALMSKQGSQYLGTFGQAGCFSFSPNKTITTGQGGLIVTNDEKIYNRLRPLKDQGRPTRGTGGDDRHDTIGYNFKMTDLQAAIGLGQLTLLKKRIERMKRNHELYQTNLGDLPYLSLFKFRTEEVPQWTDALIPERRDELVEYLKTNSIDSRKYWFPIHRQLAYKQPDDLFPQSILLSPQAVWLPSAYTLTDEDVLTVCEKIKEFFKN
ncbi:MAG: hypothetical protein A2821_03115 [Candidatus Magasanikbacteria bacterium RIFCSPHIGHO2_01_FULL_41_23]|uniref:Aminotransferase DegT n=1 Tax=Candidatus Magasanikbacteria bacterium RIFCSPLOWO2_01_FULL_40_15 TaxID=1798686 RepID=A0A1F6N3J5_9BACT|nr:MAG: hypothetical protein A2821_03115 [Candidatus Magasanikbacteria bacterium RIFCSPHIGHO2_01_FULL_41_23]OGH67328.1 MAG: hypothetical protein A3C66_01130 [Candidatus Magasanikbacteria bacterium RIFCSPHIGHO2_02_FULL_41_35]OGH76553.1 MAG: hypothetical protein A3F22_00340 [Candidatus Magasanikbacteria bacterium RIFCSPHIGHO2_12_FULL_41_16]OGH78461.1 MAG: hypothetical protein A2983_03015 [Candidatus Magasanikbacteria bacterium RIFCSPLOWO2_01_FULL_40_15]